MISFAKYFQTIADASGEIQYTESIQLRGISTETELACRTIGWDLSEFTDDVDQFDRRGPDVFVQNGIQESVEPIYAEVRKKPTNIFQVGRRTECCHSLAHHDIFTGRR